MQSQPESNLESPTERPTKKQKTSNASSAIDRVVGNCLIMDEIFFHCVRERSEHFILPPTDTGNERYAIPPSGNIPFARHRLALVSELAKHYLTTIGKSFIFVFRTPGSLIKFGETVQSILAMPGKETLGKVQIELDMFRPDTLPNAGELIKWSKIRHPHGFPQSACEHVEQWMEAVEKLHALGIAIHVNLRMRFPCRYYFGMREVSNVLREPNVRVTVTLADNSWNKVPAKYRALLMGMVEFALTGTQLCKALETQRVNLTDEEERGLNLHGCISVRPLRIIHEGPENPHHPEDIPQFEDEHEEYTIITGH